MEGTTQGDLAAMAIYEIAIVTMILMLVEINLQGNYNTFAAAYAESIFKRTNIKIPTEGKRLLGAVIGSTNYRQNYIKKIEQWITEFTDVI